MTTYALPGDAERLQGEGFDGYVAKPFRRNGLLKALRTALARLA